MKLLDVLSSPWAILPESLLEIQAICARHATGIKADIAALETRLGRPLQNTRAVTMRGATALIPITGPVFRYANLFTEVSGATSLAVLASDFAAADANPAVREIVLIIDSPGGQANGIAEFAQLVRTASKPVTAYIDNTAASAGYWIASAASKIVMAKTAMVGSIGAVITIDARKTDGQVEIISSQSPNKRADVTTDAGRAQIQTLIDGLAQVFIEDVAAYRHVSVDTVLDKFGAGGMKLAKEAVALGMADRIGTLETLLADLAATSSASFQGKPLMNAPSSQANQPPAASLTGLTVETLTAERPDIAAALRADGAAAERRRIADVEAQLLPGHETLIASLKSDGKTTGAEAAKQVLAAERFKLSAIAEQLRAESPPIIPHAQAPSDKEDAQSASTDQREAWHNKAKQYQAAHPGTDYMAALKATAAS